MKIPAPPTTWPKWAQDIFYANNQLKGGFAWLFTHLVRPYWKTEAVSLFGIVCLFAILYIFGALNKYIANYRYNTEMDRLKKNAIKLLRQQRKQERKDWAKYRLQKLIHPNETYVLKYFPFNDPEVAIKCTDTISNRGRDFEIVLSKLFKDMGYDVDLGSGSQDHGVDMIIINKSTGKRVVVQAKQRKRGALVGVDALGDVLRGMSWTGIPRGLIVTNQRFTSYVHEEQERCMVQLCERQRLEAWIRQAGSGIRLTDFD
ncbi:MAG: restriction endonuclease [Thermoplasmatales archaeon]